jgi:hypothetical protein
LKPAIATSAPPFSALGNHLQGSDSFIYPRLDSGVNLVNHVPQQLFGLIQTGAQRKENALD